MPDSRMSEKDFERWRKRLQHAKKVWIEKGIIGTEHPSTMRMLIEFYRGDHWKTLEGWGGFTDTDLVTVNKVFSVGNTLMGQLSARNPQCEALPRTERAKIGSFRVQQLLNYDIEEQNMMRPWNQCLRDHLFAPVGVERHGYTPPNEFYDKEGRQLETYRPARPGRPWIKRLPLWDTLLDPLAVTFHNDGDLRWCAFRGLKTVKQIERTQGMTARKGLAPNVASHYRDMRPKDLLDTENEDWNDLVEFWTVYEIEERTWFQMTIDGNVMKPLREPGDWPIPWEHLPIDILSVNEQMDSPFPIPIMDEMIPIQIEMNKIHTIMGRLAKNTRRLIGVQDQGVDDDELDKIEAGELIEIIKTNGPANQMIQEIRSGGFPQEMIFYVNLLEQHLREIVGVSLMDNAQRINVETAEEASRVGRGSDVHILRNQQAFEKFIESSIRNYMHGRAATMDVSELVPILGREGAAEGQEPFLTVSREDLKEDYDFKIVAGSTLPRSRDRDAQRALADIQVAGTNPELHNLLPIYERYWIARGVNPAKVMKQQQPQPPPPGEVEEKGTLDPQAFKALGEGLVQ